MLEVFLTAFGGTVTALAVAGFLGKRFLDLQVSKAIERYKSELEQRSAALKTELSIYAHEQNVGLSRIDEQRSKAIQEIYGLAMKWHDIYLQICQPNEPSWPDPQMKFQKYYTWSTSFVKEAEEIPVKVRDTAIFFQQSSYEIVSKFGMAAMELSCQFYDQTFAKVDMSKDHNFEELFPMIESARKALSEASQEEFSHLREMLVAEFRRLMTAERS
jgi:hypothetical protein